MQPRPRLQLHAFRPALGLRLCLKTGLRFCLLKHSPKDIKIFKISLFAYFACTGHEVFRPVSSRARHSACYYFGVRSTDERWAEDERSRWVLDVSRAVRLVTGMQAIVGGRGAGDFDVRSFGLLERVLCEVTQSLFPPYRISCDPQQAGASRISSKCSS